MTSGEPSESDILEWFRTLSNWGRWGEHDQLGTLNLITPERRLQATRSVEIGTAVSCARTISYEMAKDAFVPAELAHHASTGLASAIAPPRHFMNTTGEVQPDTYGRVATADTFLIGAHGMAVTHLDAPAHSLWRSSPTDPLTLYNGFPAAKVGSDGAAAGSIEVAGGGVAGRGVLLDIAHAKRVGWLEPGTAIRPADLEEAEARQGVTVCPGDILVVRTGHLARRQRLGPADPMTWAGLHVSCLPWLRERDVALLGCDTPNDVSPMRYPRLGHVVHGIGMVSLGLWMLDNGDFEELSELCRERTRWTFLFVIAPLKLQMGTGSPVNPIALL